MAVETPPYLGRSWWLVDALAADPGEPTPALANDTTADVVILGGGYTGLWTAWFLKQRDPGIDIAILEADICGGGPSGRNGGFLDSWWGHVSDMVATFGDSEARTLLEAAAPSPTEIGAWCKKHKVDAWHRAGGDLAVTTNPTQEGKWASAMEAAERIGVADRYQVLSPEQVQARCKSSMFGSGLYIADAATVHPARLARGLRKVLLKQGVRIFESSPVVRFGRGKPVIAQTPSASVHAGEAVVALGAWATPWKAFHPYVTVRGSYMVMTEPAPELIEDIGWTAGEAVRSMRASIHYLRTTPDGRIAFGLGGLQPNLGTKIDHRYAYDEQMVRRVALDLHKMFPAFRKVPLAAGWGGPINVSGYNLPFFGTTQPGNVHHGLGYTGNGVGPSHLGGKILASLVMHADDELTRLPVVTREPKRFPPEPIRSPGVLLANEAIRRKDDLEDSGRHVSPIIRLTAGLPRKLGFNLGPRTW